MSDTTTTPGLPQADDIQTAGPITIIRTPPTQFREEFAEVRVTWASGHESRVTIYGPQTRYGGRQQAQVNWSAIGSVDPEEATLYATAIMLAAQIAPTMRPATGVEEQA